ncbi:2-amino-4-hydroxy-6-hydroxymethyldihydropteridine diphosphokinase [bacterium]|nr:2-amino-4-hydroxy-6-hydroxymethyldihydropteridine diphosphokinase [bacterium]
MIHALLAFGSNVGNRSDFIHKALSEIEKAVAVTVTAASRLYETEPWGEKDQPPFLNQVVALRTSLSPDDLLGLCQSVEARTGRSGSYRWGPREIDIDLLIYGDQIIHSDTVIVPHPRLSERRFVLEPLAEIAPDTPVPGTGKTAAQLLADCRDTSTVSLYREKEDPVNLSAGNNATYIAIEGVIGAGKTSMAKLLSEELNAKLIIEEPETNPYLQDFYRDPRRYAFQAQLFFLISRYRQLLDLPQQDLFHPYMIADFIFSKDKIFAYMNLEKRDLVLYERIATLMETELPKPDLVIYLQSSTEKLLENIRKRNRKYEKHMSSDYIKRLNDAYNEFFFRYTETPLLVINTSEIDFVGNRAVLEDLMKQILNPPMGVKFYMPGNF